MNRYRHVHPVKWIAFALRCWLFPASLALWAAESGRSGAGAEKKSDADQSSVATRTLTLTGTAAAIGRMWGNENKDSIVRTCQDFSRKVDQGKVKGMAARFREIAGVLKCGHWIEEAHAIADTAGVDRDLYAAMLARRYRPGCKSFVMTAPATRDGQIIFHKTRDMFGETQAGYFKLTTDGEGKPLVYKYFGVMGTPETGLSFMVNEKGLAGSADRGAIVSDPKFDGLMSQNTLRYVAEHCADVDEASNALHGIFGEGLGAAGKFGIVFLFVDRWGNSLLVKEDGHRILEEKKNPHRDRESRLDGVYCTRGFHGNARKAIESHHGKIDVKLADTLISKTHPMCGINSVSGATFLIHPEHPETLTSIFVAFPAWGYSVPALFGSGATPRDLMNGTVYTCQRKKWPKPDMSPESVHAIMPFQEKLNAEWKTLFDKAARGVNKKRDVTDLLDRDLLDFVDRAVVEVGGQGFGAANSR